MPNHYQRASLGRPTTQQTDRKIVDQTPTHSRIN